MKKNTSLFLFIFVSIYAQATIRRVNNSPNVSGLNVYTTAQAAHNAAVAGDTIHLEPTANGSYGDLSITKQLVVISTGDYLSLNPGQQLSFLPVGTCGNIYLDAGSSNSIIHAKCGNINFTASFNNANIIISRCHISGSITWQYYTSVNNVVIKQNMIDGGINLANSNSNNITISNNCIFSGITVPSSSNAIVVNNVIWGGSTFYNTVFSNNIILTSSAISFNYSTVTGNVSVDTQLPAGNVNSENMANVFANWPFSNPTNTDQYQLEPSYSNQAIGMYAGPDPYRRACMPPVPSIFEFTVPSASSGNNINITVSTKSNN